MSMVKLIPKDEEKIQKVLEIYYSEFPRISLQTACKKVGVLYGQVSEYMLQNRLGMPDLSSDARQFYAKLKKLRQSRK